MAAFVARQPILDRKQKLHAYELLFRAGTRNQFDGSDAAEATRHVIANSVLSITLDELLCGVRGFLNFDRTLLTGDIFSILPPDKFAVEVLESVPPDSEVLAACKRLREEGYSIVLDDFVFQPCFEPLIEFCDMIKVDVRSMDRARQERLVQTYHKRRIAMLAEKVETREEFEWAFEAGYDFFQGYFFARPVILRGRQIPAAKVTCLRLLSQMQKKDLDYVSLEKIVREDVSLSYKLLRFANSALFAFRAEIHSIRHAFAVVGEANIHHWVALVTLSVMAKNKPGELITHSLVRARFCERLAELAGLQESGRVFLMGLFSLLDALLDLSLEEALLQANVDHLIRDALLGQAPVDDRLMTIFRLVCHYEQADWQSVEGFARQLRTTPAAVTNAYADAVLWSKQVLQVTARTTNTRRNVRHPMNERLPIVWEDDTGRATSTNATVCNVSLTGLQLQVNQKIPRGCVVSCDHPQLGIAGRGSVRYCNPSNGKYLIGIEFSNGRARPNLPHASQTRE